MYRYAELKYGKVVCIQESACTYSNFITFFEPSCYWVDITGQDSIEVGDIVTFVEGIGVAFEKPRKNVVTLDTAKSERIEILKNTRDNLEIQPIEYNGNLFDYDDKARERMTIAREALILSNQDSQLWTCADNSHTLLTVEDFNNIILIVALRSSNLHEKYNLLKEYINTLEDIDLVNAVTFDMDLSEVSNESISE